MGSKLDRQRAEEEANAFILGNKEKPAQDSGDTEANTGGEENNVQRESEERTPAPVQATDSADELREKLRISEARNDVLQGKYNSEIPRLNSEIKSLTEQLKANSSASTDTLNKRISELEQQLASKEPDNVSSDSDVADYISTEYDPELAKSILAMIKRHAAPQSNDEVMELRNKVDVMQRDSEQTSRELKITSLRNMLASQNIAFDKTDSDPLFHDWLAQEHPGTGQARQHFLNQHFSTGNINGAAQYYVDFKAQERSSYDKNPLSNHVEVSSNNSGGDTLAESEIWTPEDIDRLYSDLRKGKITQAEFEKHEQSLNRALQSGNVKQ